MSSSLIERLLSSSINVKRRLESLLIVCQSQVNPSWINDNNDDYDEFYRSYGPYNSDIEELESSIQSITSLIENLQHEQSINDDCQSFPNYPLCRNGWELKDIEELEEEKPLDLLILNQLGLQLLNSYDHLLNDQQCISEHINENNDEEETDKQIELTAISNSHFNVGTERNLLDLPEELLLHIFSFLSPFELITAAPTCRYIAHLILTNLYYNLELSKQMSFADVAHLLRHLRSLRSISFIDWENHISNLTWAIWFDRISQTTPNLRTIRFQNVILSPIIVCYIVEYFGNCLQTIIFDCHQQKKYEKFDLILSLLADNNIPLRRITASYQTGITNFGILQLINNLNIIVELNLLYIELINDETVKILCDKHKTHLEILKIDGAQLTDIALEYIDTCRQLKSVMIEFCTNMTGVNFYIFQNFKNLKELCLFKLTDIPLESYQGLFNNKSIFENLTTLKLGECHMIDDDCVRSIIKMCPQLIDFACTWAYGLTDDAFNDIVMNCHKLQRLSLVGCHQIFGKILNDVPMKYLNRIEYLDFQQCNQIQDDLLVELYRRKKPKIEIKNYYGSNVDDV